MVSQQTCPSCATANSTFASACRNCADPADTAVPAGRRLRWIRRLPLRPAAPRAAAGGRCHRRTPTWRPPGPSPARRVAGRPTGSPPVASSRRRRRVDRTAAGLGGRSGAGRGTVGPPSAPPRPALGRTSAGGDGARRRASRLRRPRPPRRGARLPSRRRGRRGPRGCTVVAGTAAFPATSPPRRRGGPQPAGAPGDDRRAGGVGVSGSAGSHPSPVATIPAEASADTASRFRSPGAVLSPPPSRCPPPPGRRPPRRGGDTPACTSSWCSSSPSWWRSAFFST